MDICEYQAACVCYVPTTVSAARGNATSTTWRQETLRWRLASLAACSSFLFRLVLKATFTHLALTKQAYHKKRIVSILR